MEPMLLIVLAVLVVVLLLAAGLVLIFCSGKRTGAAITGIGCLVLFVLATPAWRYAWPFDWLIPGSGTSISADIGDYRVDFVQKPGGDFYNNRFEIYQSDGSLATVTLAVDDGKCWFPSVVQRPNEVRFICMPAGVVGAINTSELVVISGNCFDQRCRFSEMRFK